MESELSKLPPGDEVAILAVDIFEDGEQFWVTEFTNEPAKLASALARVQAICEKQGDEGPSHPASKPEIANPKEVVETETIKGRNGGTVTRTTLKDGTVQVKRVNKDGKVTVDLGDVYDMAAAVKDATRKAEELRPNSQAAIVWISDGIAPIFFEDRDATEQILIRHNVIFSSLTVELRTLFKFLMPIGKPMAGWLGMSLYGSAKHLAQRSGGEAVKVGRAKDYSAGSRASSAILRHAIVSASPSPKARLMTDACTVSRSAFRRRMTRVRRGNCWSAHARATTCRVRCRKKPPPVRSRFKSA